MMRLRRLDLTRYGKFTDFSVDLGPLTPGEPDLHVIYGPNESGKSTALNGFLDLLYGIDVRSRYGFLHNYAAMRVGAVLEIGGQPTEFARIKRRQRDLLGTGDEPIDPGILSAALHGLDRGSYRTMFSLDDDILEEGGEEILASGGEIGRLLFSAAAGLSELSGGLEALQARADAFHRPNAQNSELRRLRTKIDELEAERRSLDTQASVYARLREDNELADSRYGEAREKYDQLVRERERLGALTAAMPVREALKQLRKELAPVADYPDVPLGWADEVQTLGEGIAAARKSEEDAHDEIRGLDGEFSELERDPKILAVRERIEGLRPAESRDETARTDLPKRRETKSGFEVQISHVLTRLGAPAGTSPEDLALPDLTIAELDKLSGEHVLLVDRFSSARQEVSGAKTALRLAEEDANRFGPPDETVGTLGPLLKRLRASDVAGALRSTGAALARAEARVTQALNALTPWTGDAEALARQTAPAASEATRWRDRELEFEEQTRDIRERRVRCKTECARLGATIKEMTKSQGVITDGAAADVRAKRDAAWDTHRARLDETTADAFKEKLDEDDHVRDTRVAESNRLAALRDAELKLAAEEAGLKTLADEEQTLATARAAFATEIVPALSAAALPESFNPADLPDWLARREDAQAALQEFEGHRADRDAARSEIETQSAALRAALEEADVLPPEGAAFEWLRDRAEAVFDAQRERRTQAAAADTALRKARGYLDPRNGALQESQENLARWETAWREAVSGAWIEGLEPEKVHALLPALRELTGLLAQRDELAERIKSMERDQASFADGVVALCEVLKIEAEAEPGVQLARLRHRLAGADKIETQIAEKNSARGSAISRANKAAKELEGNSERIMEMGALFSPHLKIQTLDELRDALSKSAQRAELARQISENETKLRDLMNVDTLEDANAKLEEVNAEELADRRSRIDTDVEEAHADLEARIGERQDARRALEAIGGDDAVALLDQQRCTLLLEISEKAKRALRLRLGVLAAERALRLYRDRHRSSMLAHTADAFRTITRGGFSDLTSQPENASETLIAIRADGAGSLKASEMSKGTRFQLYLALRIAGYQRFCETAGPLPFIADDIMETFDDDRAQESFGLLRQVAMRGQAIYFTHHRHLCEAAREVCGEAVQIHELPA